MIQENRYNKQKGKTRAKKLTQSNPIDALIDSRLKARELAEQEKEQERVKEEIEKQLKDIFK